MNYFEYENIFFRYNLYRHLMRVGEKPPETTTIVVPVDVWGSNNPDVPANKNSLCTLRLPTGKSSR